jgi:hypothetical protein
MTTQALKELVDSLAADEQKFNDGNNSAGSRMRKTLQEIKKGAQTLRVGVLAKQKEMKTAKGK